MLFSVTYFSQLQAGKLRSAVLSWDEPMTFEFQVGTANESLQWKLWRLRTTVAYRTWCCILNIALQNVLPSEFQVFHWHKNFHSCTELCYPRYQNWLFLSEGIFLVGFLNCDLSRALSHPSFRWKCIRTLTSPVIYFYSYISYITWPNYGIWD